MKIYTKTGDKGQTSLASGERVPKDHLRLQAYGTLDELNAILGLARSRNTNLYVEQLCCRLQTLLFVVGADLATPLPPAGQPDPAERVHEKHVKYVELCIDSLETELPPLTRFILPSGTETAGCLHLARTVCRRAERHIVTLAGQADLGPFVGELVNRISDYLFVLARYANFKSGRPDEPLSREFPELKDL